MESDGELVRASLDEPVTFEAIFERHYDAILAYARRRVGHSAGEEIAAETFVVAFERRATFDVGFASARPWLFGISTNLIRHHVRDEHTHLLAQLRVPMDPPPAPTEDTDRIDAERLRPVLIDALLSLSEAERDTFLLVALGELSYGQTAIALGVPIGTVRSRIHSARSRLRELLGGAAAIDRGDGTSLGQERWTSSS